MPQVNNIRAKPPEGGPEEILARARTVRDAPTRETPGKLLQLVPILNDSSGCHRAVASLGGGSRSSAHREFGRYWVAKDGAMVVGTVLQSPLNFAASLTPWSPNWSR